MKNRLMKFLKEEDGATIVEYVIMLSIVAAIVFFAFPSLRNAIVNWISGAFSDTDSAITGAGNQYICNNADGTTTQVDDLADC